MSNKPYSVNHWGSHPDEDNDDCWSGEDFDTIEEALAAYHKPAPIDVAFIEIDGIEDADLPKYGIERVRKNPIHRRSKSDNDEWQREQAHEAGMLHGAEAYNEVMGYD